MKGKPIKKETTKKKQNERKKEIEEGISKGTRTERKGGRREIMKNR
jgi:hypothetical protein